MKLKMLGILCLYSIGTQCVLTKEETIVISAWAKTMPEDDPLRLSIEARLECENSSDSDDTSRSSSLTPPLPLAKAYTAVCRGGGGACVADQTSKDTTSSPDNKVYVQVRPKRPNQKSRPESTRRDLEYWINQGSSI